MSVHSGPRRPHTPSNSDIAQYHRNTRINNTRNQTFLEPRPSKDSGGNKIPLEVRSNPNNDVTVSSQDLLQRLNQIQASAQTSSPQGPGFTQGTGNYPERGLSIPNQAYDFAESNRIITSLIGGYKTEIDRQIASLENRKPPLSKVEKEKQKKYREIFKKIFDILENQTINVGNILQDTNLMNRLSNVVINYPNKAPGFPPNPYRGIDTVNGLKEYYNHMIFIIEAIGSIIDHSNFPAPFRVKSGEDSVSLIDLRRDSQGNYIDSTGQIVDHTETFVMLSAINGNLEPVANNLIDLEGNTREEQLEIHVRPRNHPDPAGGGKNKATSRASFTFNENDMTYKQSRVFARIDLDERDSSGNLAKKSGIPGTPTVTLDLEFPTTKDIFTYYPVLVNGRNVNLYEMDPALHDFVIRLHNSLGSQAFTHHFPTGITFNNEQEFTEFMEWIIGSLHN